MSYLFGLASRTTLESRVLIQLPNALGFKAAWPLDEQNKPFESGKEAKFSSEIKISHLKWLLLSLIAH